MVIFFRYTFLYPSWLKFGIVLLLMFLLFDFGISGYYVITRSQIKFDRDRFEIKEKVIGWTFNQFSGAVSDIVGIFAARYYGVEIRLVRRFGKSTHLFGNAWSGLSDADWAWLAQEIRDWLNLK